MPGQCIDIGFVYPFINNENVKDELCNLIRYLRNWFLVPTSIIASRDIDGEEYISAEEWGNLDFFDTEHVASVCKLIADNFNGIITIKSDFLGRMINGITIVIERNEVKAKGYYCIDISIEGSQLIEGCDLMHYEKYDEPINNRINSTTNDLISFMKEFFAFSEYAYAYCDSEVQMECTPDILLSNPQGVYSVEIVPLESILNVRKHSWNIDGFSQRYEPA